MNFVHQPSELRLDWRLTVRLSLYNALYTACMSSVNLRRVGLAHLRVRGTPFVAPEPDVGVDYGSSCSILTSSAMGGGPWAFPARV